MDDTQRNPDRLGPGHINITGQIAGHYTQCKCAIIDPAPNQELDEAINAWFEAHPNAMLVDIDITNAGVGRAIIFWTFNVTELELREFQEVTVEARRIVDERKAERAKAEQEGQALHLKQQEKLKTDAAGKLKELERLAELGRRHEKNCGRKNKEK